MEESERQLLDASGILTSRANELDVHYIVKWAKQLDLIPQWERVKELTV